MVGILFESNEWSDWKLHDELEQALGEPIAMIDMESDGAIDLALRCDFLISRVFASAIFRDHEKSAKAMLELLERLGDKAIMINPARAHYFEISKNESTCTLAEKGFDVPNVQAIGTPDKLLKIIASLEYPCIIKPDCGGRTTYTARLNSGVEAADFISGLPQMDFIIEDFVYAKGNFITRIEVIDGKIALVVKRSIESSGLSSYHEGSSYEPYPDCPSSVCNAAMNASRLLDIQFGSFDIIESQDGKAYIIDANSVSNVSEDCTEVLGIDLMKEHAKAIAKRIETCREGKMGCLP